MYPNLLLLIFSKIHEKYHQYLRLAKPRWKAISKKFIIPTKWQRKIGLNQKLIHIGKIVKYYDCFGIENWDGEENQNLFSIGDTILCDACQIGDKILINVMLSDIKSECWYSALDYIYSEKRLDIAKILIEFGQRHFRIYNFELVRACQFGWLDIAKLIIEKKLLLIKDNDKLSGDDYSRLHYCDKLHNIISYYDLATWNCWEVGLYTACKYEYLDLVKLMIDKGYFHINIKKYYINNKNLPIVSRRFIQDYLNAKAQNTLF